MDWVTKDCTGNRERFDCAAAQHVHMFTLRVTPVAPHQCACVDAGLCQSTKACFYLFQQEAIKKYVTKFNDDCNSLEISPKLIIKCQICKYLIRTKPQCFQESCHLCRVKHFQDSHFKVLDVLKLSLTAMLHVPHLWRQPCLEPSPSV